MKDPTYHQRMGGRTKAKIDLLRNHWDVDGKVCLDIGAGRGDITRELIYDGATYLTAIEASESFDIIATIDGWDDEFDDLYQCDIIDFKFGRNMTEHEANNIPVDQLPFDELNNTYDLTLCLSVMHHVIGNHGWAVTLETWERILKVSDCVYFEIGLPSERGSFYWKDKMKGMTDQDVLDKFADGCATFDRIGQLPIHGVPRPIFYVEK